MAQARKRPASTDILIPGRRIESPAPAATHGSAFKLTPSAEFVFDRVRAAGVAPERATIGDDELVVLELENGLRIWTSGKLAREEYGARPAAGRGADGVEFELITTLPIDSPERGVVSWALKALRIFKVDPVDVAASASAAVIADKIEAQLIGKPGLYKCKQPSEALGAKDPIVGGEPIIAPQTLPAAPERKATLIFVHGTASSSTGSFAGLWAQANRGETAKLFEHYEGRIYGFEHRTLSLSPIDNALQLAQSLPNGATVHLVSHSRGGLVAELLCRGNVAKGAKPFGPADLAVFERAASEAEGAARQALLAQRDALKKLSEVLEARQIKVERFVRVGCPARGTTLASGRFDRWLSIALNLVDRLADAVPGVGDMTDVLTDLVAAVVKKRLDPSELPGLHAQTPVSPLVRMLNRPDVLTGADLAVIAGEVKAGGLLDNLAALAANWFFGQENDLVVDTKSMDGGADRAIAWRALDDSDQVNHLRYFTNPGTVKRLRAGLIGSESERREAFAPLDVTPGTMAARAAISPRRAPTPNAPVVFVLPGIMGSRLEVNGQCVWLDKLKMAGGAIAELAFDKKVKPAALLAEYYQPWADAIANYGEAVLFPYDWRQSVEDNADELARQVSGVLDRVGTQRAVQFAAHSMGGLVVRTMIARHPELWRSITQHDDARLVMMGTPNEGSHAIAALLLGRDTLIQLLAIADFSHSLNDILGIIKRFPGVLELLPHKSDDFDYFSEAGWKALEVSTGFQSKGAPDKADLQRAARIRDVLASSPIDPRRMYYIAGCGEPTVERVEKNGDVIELVNTLEGDGSVLWRTGIPEALREANTWYAEVSHGDLTGDATSVGACVEILRSGGTNLLAKRAPSVRAAREKLRYEREPIRAFPTTRDVLDAAVGKRRSRPTARRAAALTKVKVTVRHGDLRNASYPLFVGHYFGDPIVSAEAVIDRQLDARLRQRHALGLYPGRAGETALFPNPRLDPEGPEPFPGAVVLGLGQVGELGSGTLTQTLRRGVLELASAVSEGRFDQSKLDGDGIGVSTLAIGTGTGGIGVQDSINAILKAIVEANDAIVAQRRGGELRLIRKVEIVELYEDRAHEFFHQVRALQQQADYAEAIELEAVITQTDGALRRVRFGEDRGWWRRIQITEESREGAPEDSKGMRFKLLTDTARSEVHVTSGQRKAVDRLIDSAVRATTPELAKTLFELLIPNALKDAAPRNESLLLLLDEQTAAYPWELLQDGQQRDSKPMVTEAPVIRQFSLDVGAFRADPRYATSNRALVIGDTDTTGMRTTFAELPGAQAEARLVAEKLAAAGFDAPARLKVAALDALQLLFSGDYRVVHFAAHGVHQFRENKDDDPVTGMVLGEGLYLTPAQIEQMRVVPELVFLNCCYLGLVASERGSMSRLAANLATQFIRNGAKCVIAAGWSIHDEGARVFAGTFYELLLAGQTFAQAVFRARQQAFKAFPGVNTWGAYQCYGDPDYRLRKDNLTGATRTRATFASPSELRARLETLEARASDDASNKSTDLADELVQLRKDVPANWMQRDGALCEAFGLAYGALEDFDAAIECFELALRARRRAPSIGALEQLINFQARQLARSALQPQRGDTAKKAVARRTATKSQAEVQLPRLIEQVKSLVEIYPTAERRNILGSAYRRLAIVAASASRTSEVQEALKRSIEQYALANELDPDPYPASQVALSELLRDWTTRDKARAQSANVQALQALIHQQAGTADSFWSRVYAADWSLLAALQAIAASDARGGDRSSDIANVVGDYQAALKRGANRRQRRSLGETFDFIAVILRHQRGRARDAGRQRSIDAALAFVDAVKAGVG